MALPKDPFMLLSVVNTALRDRYPSLDALCEDMGENKDEIITSLQTAGFEYQVQINQFR